MLQPHALETTMRLDPARAEPDRMAAPVLRAGERGVGGRPWGAPGGRRPRRSDPAADQRARRPVLPWTDLAAGRRPLEIHLAMATRSPLTGRRDLARRANGSGAPPVGTLSSSRFHPSASRSPVSVGSEAPAAARSTRATVRRRQDRPDPRSPRAGGIPPRHHPASPRSSARAPRPNRAIEPPAGPPTPTGMGTADQRGGRPSRGRSGADERGRELTDPFDIGVGRVPSRTEHLAR